MGVEGLNPQSLPVHRAGSPLSLASRLAVGFLLAWTVAGRPILVGQSPGNTAPPAASKPHELVSQDVEPTFKLRVERNLVLVRVVVRDKKGQAVRELRKEDFRLFDNGKPQSVAYFTVENSAPTAALSLTAKRPADEEAPAETARLTTTPQRFVALFFDDVHMKIEDIARTRDAAERFVSSSLTPSDRVGIFTTSGRITLDFTGDRDQVHQTLSRLHFNSNPLEPQENRCPDISDYQAFQIVHRHDQFALGVATDEAYICYFKGTGMPRDEALAHAQSQAESDAVQTLSMAETRSEYALRGLNQLIRRLAVLPGQRQLVLVSPGFFTASQEFRETEIADRALRANVIVSSLDAKGLYTVLPFGDASKRVSVLPDQADLIGHKAQILLEGVERDADILRYLAVDTGGEFFHNSNDLDLGFRRVSGLPEFSYVLGFSPSTLKFDGRFHSVTVKLAQPAGFTLQARRGYFAPAKPYDSAAQAKQEVEDAVFSQDEMNGIPMELHTQFFKLNESDVRLSVVMHLDLHFLKFRKQEGRNLNDLTVVTAIFDRDGKYLEAREKRLEFRLYDTSLERLAQSGLNMRTSFNIKPGTYLVRQVVRDAEGGQLTGRSRAIEIPY